MNAPYYQDDEVVVHHGDCIDVLAELEDASVDSVVTDPPYSLGFMGRSWDTFGQDVGRGAQARVERATEVTPSGRGHSTSAGPYLASGVDSLRAAGQPFQLWCQQWATECLRVLKPGGHLLAFGGTRTWHRLACAIEDAGFEIRDSIAWLYGSGFPKSLDVSKAIDKLNDRAMELRYELARHITAPATDAAKAWQGWGTAVKPAFEPIVVARKPLSGTVAANVVAYGTGALNIDACRVVLDGESPPTGSGGPNTRNSMAGGIMHGTGGNVTPGAGRWPANVVLDEGMADELDKQSGDRPGSHIQRDMKSSAGDGNSVYGKGIGAVTPGIRDGFNDSGGASRFFPVFKYTAKAPTTERPTADGVSHPTVKPLELMRWLVRLVTPPHGLVLDPFAGSGTTAEACVHEHLRCITIEREADYLPVIVARLSKPMAVGFDFDGEVTA